MPIYSSTWQCLRAVRARSNFYVSVFGAWICQSPSASLSIRWSGWNAIRPCEQWPVSAGVDSLIEYSWLRAFFRCWLILLSWVGSSSSLSCDCEDCAWNTSTWSSSPVSWACMVRIIGIICWTCSVCDSSLDCRVHYFPVGGKWLPLHFLQLYSRDIILINCVSNLEDEEKNRKLHVDGTYALRASTKQNEGKVLVAGQEISETKTG